MSKSLLTRLDCLHNLNPDTKRLWGKMSAQHMVEHLILSVRISSGKLNVGCFNPPEKLGTLKRFLMSSRPLPREFINPIIGEDLIPLEFPDLGRAKEELVREVFDFYVYFENNPEAKPLNPTFGELNKDEWEIFHTKHFNHHFSQFGLL